MAIWNQTHNLSASGLDTQIIIWLKIGTEVQHTTKTTMAGKSSSELFPIFEQDWDEFVWTPRNLNPEIRIITTIFQDACCLWYFSYCRNLCQQFHLFTLPCHCKKRKQRQKMESSTSSKLLFSQRSAWRYVWGRTGEENNLSHPPHPAKESTSIRPRFPYWLINCSAKYSALHYSSCRQDVSFAAKFQGQMGYRNVIEIKLVGCAAGASRSETRL